MARPQWDPNDTDGLSEDWIAKLGAAGGDSVMVETPLGVVFPHYEDVHELLTHPALSVPVVDQYHILGITGPMLERAQRIILGLDGAAHSRLRNLVNRAFTPRAVAGLAEGMRDYLNDRFDAQEAAGTETIDLLHDVLDEYPAAVIGAMMGIPEADIGRLAQLSDSIVSAQFSLNKESFEAFTHAARQFDEYLYQLLEAKRREPGDDLISELALTEIEGDSLNDDEIVSISSSVLNAGMDTTRHQSCFGAILFAEFPEQWAELRANPDLVANAVEEILRFRPVTPLLPRINREPFEYKDVSLPASTFISLAGVVANRDEELNPGDPWEFDIARKNPRHLTFGFGAHYCLGASLARLELLEFLKVLAERFETIEMVGDSPRRPVMGVYGVRSLHVRAPAAA